MSDHEQLFRDRQQDSERTMYIAGKIEGVEPNLQSRGDSSVNNGGDVGSNEARYGPIHT